MAILPPVNTNMEYGWIITTNSLSWGGADVIDAWGHSTVEVRYTSTPLSNSSGIRGIRLADYSTLFYLNGVTDSLSISENATAILKGGQINKIQSLQKVINDTPYITIKCLEGWSWLYNTSGEIKGITGLWNTGTEFSIQFIDKTDLGFDPVWKNINVIPEPATVALLCVSGLLLRRKR